jgi:hypothetical protein
MAKRRKSRRHHAGGAGRRKRSMNSWARAVQKASKRMKITPGQLRRGSAAYNLVKRLQHSV